MRGVVALAGSSLLLVTLGVARPVRACSCVAEYVAAVWPRDAATEVPLDAPIVIASYGLERVEVSLRSEDGAEVELVERRQLVPGALGCSSLQYGFFAPSALLERGVGYELIASSEGETRSSVTTRFSTGATTRSAPAPELELELFGIVTDGQRRLEAFLQTPVDEPLFVLARGETATETHALDPMFSDTRRFGVPFGFVSCADLTVLDVTGATLVSEELCRPTKCTALDEVTFSSCGGEVFGGPDWEGWQRIDTACSGVAASAPASDFSGGGPDSVGDAVGATSEASSSTEDGRRVVGGCGLAARRAEPRSSYWLLVAAALGAARSRRRR